METATTTTTTEVPVPPAKPEAPATLLLSDTAAVKVSELLEKEGNPDYFLRVAVQPGGCSGLRYSIYFDDRKLDGDVESKFGDVTLRVDRMSAPYLKGAKLDWIEDLRMQQSGFTIDNPNASGSCACGDSFH
ncbi:MAG TPA: iron-sulfur cluster assembly accessory protein [Actinomycetota bacterium]|nr:iron-sulfur cluster assembly accessory protein [Actinomycetota bacterium]